MSRRRRRDPAPVGAAREVGIEARGRGGSPPRRRASRRHRARACDADRERALEAGQRVLGRVAARAAVALEVERLAAFAMRSTISARAAASASQDHLRLDGERKQPPGLVGDARLPDVRALALVQRASTRRAPCRQRGGEEVGLRLERRGAAGPSRPCRRRRRCRRAPSACRRAARRRPWSSSSRTSSSATTLSGPTSTKRIPRWAIRPTFQSFMAGFLSCAQA